MKPWCGMSGETVKEARIKIPEKVLENVRISPRCEISRVKCAAVRWLEKKKTGCYLFHFNTKISD